MLGSRQYALPELQGAPACMLTHRNPVPVLTLLPPAPPPTLLLVLTLLLTRLLLALAQAV
jgi:hypothetical protein